MEAEQLHIFMMRAWVWIHDLSPVGYTTLNAKVGNSQLGQGTWALDHGKHFKGWHTVYLLVEQYMLDIP